MSSPDLEPTQRGPGVGQRVFGRYTLLKVLGRGGMGVVWRARDESLGGDVALKFLPEMVRWDPAAFEDLKAEARRARQLSHPNIVRIHDFIEDAGAAAISMELVEGKTLTELRLAKAGQALDPEEIAPWLPQLGAALDYAHQQAKVVHRDLKPANLMLAADGLLKVADFGVARSLQDATTRVSQLGSGTLVYMSPQQAMGEEPVPADDIYAVGATLYELLTGKPPFYTGDVRLQLFRRAADAVSQRRRAAGIAQPALPAEWDRMIAACLEKDPGKRPATAGYIARSLQPRAAKGNELTGGRPHRFWVTAGAAAAVVALAVAGAIRSMPFSADPVAAKTAVAVPASDAIRAFAAWNFDGNVTESSGRAIAFQQDQRSFPVPDRFGRIDRAMHLSGGISMESEQTGLLAFDAALPFSISLWVRPQGANGLNAMLVRLQPSAVGEAYWSVELSQSHPDFYIGGLQRANPVRVRMSAEVQERQWGHLAAVSDGQRVQFYLNGANVGEQALGEKFVATRSASLMVGYADPYAANRYTGDLDDLRLWRRALSQAEVAALADRSAPPRFAISRGTYAETEDLAAAIGREFGSGARLADWQDLRRWHADDTRAWADEVGYKVGGLDVFVQNGGQRYAEPSRHYFVSRFDGKKPDYYLAHDEIGGATLALGSWHGVKMSALVALPPAVPRRESLTRQDDGGLGRSLDEKDNPEALRVEWTRTYTRELADTGAKLELRLRDGRQLVAEIVLQDGGRFALRVGDASRPEVNQTIGASYNRFDFAAVLVPGEVRFRAVSALGAVPLFQERAVFPGLRAADVVSVRLGGVDAAELFVE